MPRYRLELNFDSADRVTIDESPNYVEGFAYLGVGIVILALGLVGMYLNSEDLSWGRILVTIAFVGFCSCCLGMSNFIGSSVVLGREHYILTIRRRFLGIRWTHQYQIGEIEQFFEALTGDNKRTIAIEFTNLRSKRVTLWGRSATDQTARLNEVLKKFRKHRVRQTGQVHDPMTDDERWALMKANAELGFRRHKRRSWIALVGLLGVTVTFSMLSAGGPTYGYWRIAGLALILAWMVLGVFLTLEIAFTVQYWTDIRSMRKLDERFGPPTT